jgi:hypothetical protein
MANNIEGKVIVITGAISQPEEVDVILFRPTRQEL